MTNAGRTTDLPRIYAMAFRRLREFRGYSQTELGERMELTKSTISKIETGKQTLDSLALERLLRAVGVSLTTFHRVCQVIEQELDLLGGESRRLLEDPAPPRAAPSLRRLRLSRQAIGPLPGSDLRLLAEVFLEASPVANEEADTTALSEEVLRRVWDNPDDAVYDDL